MEGLEEIMDYKKIPSDRIVWVKEQWAKRNYVEVVKAFREWKVIGNVCGTCGVTETIGEFLKYWVREKLI